MTKSTESTQSSLSGGLILLAYYATLALLAVGSLFAESRTWGFNAWGYTPIWLRAVIMLGAIALPWLIRGHTGRVAEASGKSHNWTIMAIAVVLGLGVCFVLFRTRLHMLGDGYQLLSRLDSGAVPIRPWNPGVYFLQDNLFALLGGEGRDAALTAFRLISWSAGLLFLLGMVTSAARLFERTSDRLWFVLGVALGGHGLLFFGYVENYPMFGALIGLFVLFGLLAVRGKVSRWWVIVPLALAAPFHPFAAAFLPALGFALVFDSRLLRWYGELRGSIRLALWTVVALAVAGVLYYLQSDFTFLRFALVPWTENLFTVEGYTLLSAKHVVDFANLVFQFSPVILILIAAMFSRPMRSILRRPEYRFLTLAILPSLLIAFVFDPKLGMARDWDIFAFASFPLAALAMLFLIEQGKSGRGPILAVALLALTLTGRVAVLASVDRAEAMYLDLADMDKIKNRSGLFVLRRHHEETEDMDRAKRLVELCGERYPQERWFADSQELAAKGQEDKALQLLRRVVRIDPTFASAWGNIGVILAKRGEVDSAQVYLKIADGLNPYNPDTYNNLGGTYIEQGDYDRAERYWLKSWELDPDSFIPCQYLMRLYARQKRGEDYVAVMTKGAKHKDAPPGLIRQYADHLASQRRNLEAARQYRRALARGLDSAVVRQAQAKYPGLHVID